MGPRWWSGMALPEYVRLGPARLVCLLPLLIAMIAGIQAGTDDGLFEPSEVGPWRPDVPVSIRVHDGRATFRMPSTGPGSEYAVIVSSMSRSPGPFPVHLSASSAEQASIPETIPAEAVRPLPKPMDHPATRTPVPPRQPASRRDFHMMVRDGDITSPSNYLAVHGILRAVGKRIQVYVAAEDLGQVSREFLEDVVATFDDRVFPTSAASVGLAHDIDGDGRFTVLVSSWLSRLGNGRHAVDGFVRVTDLDPLYSPPFGNRCDMMYLSASLRPGPYLRTIMAHEYMHAVVFTLKSLPTIGAGRTFVEEEGWLDEALAHLAEDVHAFSRSNIDYRVSAFLSQPERYQLVVEDYYAADLFRSHGHRGATYLFLRWCVDQYGPELPRVLAASRMKGVANLERATGCAFSELYRRWSVALFESGLAPQRGETERGTPSYRSVNIRGPLEGWQLAGPRTTRIVADGESDTWETAGTSSHYVVVRSNSAGALEVRISGPAEAELQVTAIPLPTYMGRLEISARTSTGPDGELRLRASIREGGGSSVRLSALAWESLTPPADGRMPGFRRGELDSLGIASSFGTSAVPVGGRLGSLPIHLRGVHPDSGPLVIKLIGTDSQGRRVAAWAEVNAPVSNTAAGGSERLTSQGT